MLNRMLKTDLVSASCKSKALFFRFSVHRKLLHMRLRNIKLANSENVLRYNIVFQFTFGLPP